MEAAESKTLGEIRIIRPEEIERRSMEIIRSELGDRAFSADEEPGVLKHRPEEDEIPPYNVKPLIRQ